MMRYFRLMMTDNSRWFLAPQKTFADGSPIDQWSFTKCQVVTKLTPIPIEVYQLGTQVDYNETPFGVLVVSRKMAEVIQSVAVDDIQRIPVAIQADGEWEIVNVLRCIDCIDHDHSIIQYYPSDDLEKPNKPRGVAKLVIHSARVFDAHIFKPVDWTVVTVVSEVLKEGIERNRFNGIEFVEVS